MLHNDSSDPYLLYCIGQLYVAFSDWSMLTIYVHTHALLMLVVGSVVVLPNRAASRVCSPVGL